MIILNVEYSFPLIPLSNTDTVVGVL